LSIILFNGECYGLNVSAVHAYAGQYFVDTNPALRIIAKQYNLLGEVTYPYRYIVLQPVIAASIDGRSGNGKTMRSDRAGTK